MKHIQLFEDFQGEINEASKEWNRVGEGNRAQLVRFFGKTFLCILFVDGKIVGRDDNGKNPSKSYEEEATPEGFDKILAHISTPHPSPKDKEWLLSHAQK